MGNELLDELVSIINYFELNKVLNIYKEKTEIVEAIEKIEIIKNNKLQNKI